MVCLMKGFGVSEAIICHSLHRLFFLSTNAYIALIVLNIKTKHDVSSLFMYQTCFYSSWKKSIPMHKLNCDFLKVAESKCTNITTSKWNTEGKNQESENNHNKYKGSLLDPNRINQGITQLNVIWKEWIGADDKWQMYSMQKITLKCFPHSQINWLHCIASQGDLWWPLLFYARNICLQYTFTSFARNSVPILDN